MGLATQEDRTLENSPPVAKHGNICIYIYVYMHIYIYIHAYIYIHRWFSYWNLHLGGSNAIFDNQRVLCHGKICRPRVAAPTRSHQGVLARSTHRSFGGSIQARSWAAGQLYPWSWNPRIRAVVFWNQMGASHHFMILNQLKSIRFGCTMA